MTARGRNWLGATGLAVACALVVVGCDPQTAGAPRNGMFITADFETIRNLVPGHAVRVADVKVGSVDRIDLCQPGTCTASDGSAVDGYLARVTMIIEPDRRIPAGTVALIQKTSLLGENYVGLQFPPEFDDDGPFLGDGDAIGKTGVLPDIEQVAGQAAEFVGALAVDDLSTIINAASEGLVGNGQLLNQLIADLAAVTGAYADNAQAFGAGLDDFAALGEELAAGTNDFVILLDSLDGMTEATARQRTKMVGMLADLSDLAQIIDATLIGRNARGFEQAIQDLAPIVSTLADERATLEELLDGLEIFVGQIELAIKDELVGVFGFLNPEGPPAAAASSSNAGRSQADQLTWLMEPAP